MKATSYRESKHRHQHTEAAHKKSCCCLTPTSKTRHRKRRWSALPLIPESPESFMKRPKRRRWVNEKYTRWVKTQPCARCGKPADESHHLIGHGQGGMGTKSHDIFTLPLCREHHNELHADPLAFEEKHGSQVDLIFRFLDHAFATGVLG
ncbi:DUF968 domain-containing protein [Escherichia coli]